MEICPVYSFCSFKECMVYVHIQIAKIHCFVCLSNCYDKVDKIDLKDKNRSERQLSG